MKGRECLHADVLVGERLYHFQKWENAQSLYFLKLMHELAKIHCTQFTPNVRNTTPKTNLNYFFLLKISVSSKIRIDETLIVQVSLNLGHRKTQI